MSLNEKTDLTRWNRAGLSQFQYVDGNAVTFLETLRLELAETFDEMGKSQWPELEEWFPESANETRLQTRKRIRDQYYDRRRDYAWEILRSFARSAHILGTYMDAYANEAYLSTATEWDSLRKLMGMLNYRPSPPASAQTYLALLFKEGASGTVDRGFAVKNKPGDGEQTIVFETQEKVEGCDRINRIHLHQWDQNLILLDYNAATGKVRFYTQDGADGVNVGDQGVLAGRSSAMGVEVALVADHATVPYLELTLLSGTHWSPLSRYEAVLYLQPDFISSPLANGERSALLEGEMPAVTDDIVFIARASGWQARQVRANALRHMEFAQTLQPSDEGMSIHRSRVVKRQTHARLKDGIPVHVLPKALDAGDRVFVDATAETRATDIGRYTINGVDIWYVDTSYTGDLYYPDESAMGKIKAVQLEGLRFSGKPPEIETGDWVLVHLADGKADAWRVDKISVDEDWCAISPNKSFSKVDRLAGAFKSELRHKDWNVNKGRAWNDDSTDIITILELNNAGVLDVLVLGQKVICASGEQAFVAEIKDMSLSSAGIAKLSLSPPFHQNPLAAEFNRNNMIVYGNAVRASHGETQPEKIIGNGDASKGGQCFELASDEISWLADPGFSTGVRADLNLRVGQRQWQQVEELSFSSAEAHHYQVLVSEDNKLSVCFGDGRHGRRLPTGIDNIRVRYRTGYGDAGNLLAHALVKILHPHPLIDDFMAPLASSGGAEKEPIEAMRENGPATVLAMKRAVSLDDFTHLAAHHSMVWQARAFEKMPDRPARSLIEVVVVPAGGATFSPGSEIAMLIQRYLVQNSIPSTPVSVVSYRPLFIKLELTIMVDEAAYDKNQVARDAAEHLEASLDIQKRRLGQPLFRSEILALVEEVEGVENGHCNIMADPFSGLHAASRPRLHTDGDGMVRKVAIQPFQVLYLDVDHYPLQISSQTYEI